MDIITKQEAKERGLTHYFTGKPCKHGHIVRRYVRDGVCTECGNRYRREKYHRNPSREVAKVKQWQDKNKTRYTSYNAVYRRKNKDILSKKCVEYQKKRKAEDPLFALKERIRSLIKSSISNQGFSKRTKTAQILGCTWEEFKKAMEAQFLPGMTWDNRHLWHLDHIVPISSATTEDEAISLNHCSNLRPIWAADNISKKDKRLFLI